MRLTRQRRYILRRGPTSREFKLTTTYESDNVCLTWTDWHDLQRSEEPGIDLDMTAVVSPAFAGKWFLSTAAGTMTDHGVRVVH